MGSKLPSRFLNEIKETVRRSNFEVKNDSQMKFAPTSIRAGSLIDHKNFGNGIVINEHEGLIDVVFHDPKIGRKTLIANHPFITLIK